MFIVLLGFIHADRESGAGHYSFINMVYWRHVSYNRHRDFIKIRIRDSDPDPQFAFADPVPNVNIVRDSPGKGRVS